MRTALALSLSLALGLAAARMPLLGVLGYESAQAAAWLLPPLALFVWGGSWKVWGRNPRPAPGSAPDLLPIAAYLLLPACVLTVNAHWIPNCNLPEGWMFYALLVGGNAWVQWGLWIWLARRGWPVRPLWLAVGAGVAAVWLVHALAQPAKFVYSAFWGFFPGPLYDEVVVPDRKVWLSRGVGLALGGFFWLDALSQGRKGAGSGGRAISRMLLGVAVAGWMLYPRLHLWVDRGALQEALGGEAEIGGVRVYYDADRFLGREGAAQREAMLEDIAYTYEHLRAWMERENEPPGRPLTVYVHRDSRSKKEWIGAGDTQLADTFNRELHVDYAPPPHPSLRHELVHLLAADWAPPFGATVRHFGLVEGLAKAAERDGTRRTPDGWSRWLQIEGKLVPLERMLDARGFWKTAANKAYGQWGSFCGWLIAREGWEKFREAYAGAPFEAVYGRTLPQLETEWRGYLETVPLHPEEVWSARQAARKRSLFESPCAHELARRRAQRSRSLREKDYAAALQQCRTIDAFGFHGFDDAWDWLETARAAGDEVEQRRLIGRLRDHPDRDAESDRRLTAMEADLEWRAGRIESAQAGYEAASDPDLNTPLQRELALKRAVLREGTPEEQRALMDYLEPSRAPVQPELTLVHPAQHSAAVGWVFSYLLLKRLASEGHWETIEAWRSRLGWDSAVLPDPRLDRERRRSLAEADAGLGRHEAAEAQFRRLAALARFEGERRGWADEADRASWKRSRAGAR